MSIPPARRARPWHHLAFLLGCAPAAWAADPATPAAPTASLGAWRRMPSPVFPDVAKGLSSAEYRCVATLEVDARGRVAHVAVTGCPEFLHEGVQSTLSRWRARPPRVAGVGVPTQALVAIHFSERGGDTGHHPSRSTPNPHRAR